MRHRALALLKRALPAALFAVVLIPPCTATAQQPHVFNCVRFAENGNDIVVDKDCISKGLRSGADPNWINREAKRQTSTLSHYVELISISRDSRVSAEGIHAVQALIDGGVKLQPTLKSCFSPSREETLFWFSFFFDPGGQRLYLAEERDWDGAESSGNGSG